MSKVDLLFGNELPAGFVYPDQFGRIIDLGILDLEPWYMLQGDILREVNKGLRTRYPQRSLVPFARRQDNDDTACWDAAEPGRVVVIHDFASSGWEQRAAYGDFYQWLRQAIEDLIEFDS